MATTIAKGVVEIGIDPKYIEQLNSVRANLNKFSKGVTQALKPISLAMGAFGGLAIKKALEKNSEEAKRWKMATDKVNYAMAGVGEKILKASFAGKTLYQWMDKFAASLNKLTQGDVQKLVDSFLIINGVLLSMKALKIVGGLAGSAATAGKAITAKEMIGAEVAGGAAQAFLTRRAIASEIAKKVTISTATNIPVSEIVRSREFNPPLAKEWAQKRVNWNRDWAFPGSATRATMDIRNRVGWSGAAVSGAELGTATATGSWLSKGAPMTGVAYGAAITALFAVIAGALAAGIRGLRGKWDDKKSSFSNIFSEIGTWIEKGIAGLNMSRKGIELFGRALGRIASGTNPRIAEIKGEMEAREKADKRKEELNRGTVGLDDPEFILRGREIAEQEKLKKKEENEEKLRKFEKESMEWQEKNKSNIERRFQRRQEIEENLKKARETADELEVEYMNNQIDIAEQMKEKFSGKFGSIGFYSAEESYRAATGWQAELLQYEKDKKEFEKEKSKKLKALVDNGMGLKSEMEKLAKIFEKLMDEANAYNVK